MNNHDEKSGHISRGSSHDTLLSLSASRSTSELETNNGFSSSSSSSALPSTSSSILQPIRISDARARSYLVGSVGCQDSLLGSDELFRYFPSGKMTLLIVTWNMSSKSSSGDINDLLLPQSISFVPDLYAIGVQEAPGRGNQDIKQWEINLQTTIGPSHVMLHSCSIGVLHLAIFLRRDLIWFCTIPEDGWFNTRPSATNVLKTKGAIGVSFSFFGTSFLFINCHLSAHEGRLKDRIDEYEKICTSINLPKNLLPLKPRYVSKDVTARFDCVFWCGDLNFRVERPYSEVIQLLNQMNDQLNPSMECLLQHDQLIKIMERGNAFNGFSEGTVNFPPSYKFKIGTNDYDTVIQRVPSFTDRILYRSKRPNHISCLHYDWIPQMDTSDHKPVFALMDVNLRPGRDDALVLNAGSFNRDVYIEALKRRANDAEMDARRGSLICSVS